jgi:hypothetical protein
MKNTLKQSFVLAAALLMVLNACEGEGDALINERLEENPLPSATTYDAGTADFSTVVTIGNSLTAGYMDGALYNMSQHYSIGNMLAQQLGTTVGEGFSFVQPAINSEDGFNTSVTNPVGSTVFGRFKLDVSIPGPSPTVDGDPIQPYTGPSVHNFGVPGIQVAQLLTPLTGGPAAAENPAYNPFYARFAANPGTSTILGEVVAANPTFFSLWIGNNDVLGYAASGASNPAILTSDADFTTYYSTVITTLISNTSADGIVTNIPFLLALPYFRAVTYDNVVLDEATAAQLNAGLASVNAAIQATAALGTSADDIAQRLISYSAGKNPILIHDDNLEDLGPKFDMLVGAGAITAEQRAALAPYEQSRPMKGGATIAPGVVDNELVTLGAATVLGQLADPTNPLSINGLVLPLDDRYVITAAEYLEIEVKRQTFNAIISNIVSQPGVTERIAYYNTDTDVNGFLDIFGLSDGVPGITVDGVALAPDFSPNGVLSTDGVHPNPRGNAIVVNRMLDVIEAKFGSTLPRVNALSLPTVTLCSTGDCLSEQ